MSRTREVLRLSWTLGESVRRTALAVGVSREQDGGPSIGGGPALGGERGDLQTAMKRIWRLVA